MIVSRFVKIGSFIGRNPKLATIGAGAGGLTAGWVGANAKRDLDDMINPHKNISLTSLIIILLIIAGILYFIKNKKK